MKQDPNPSDGRDSVRGPSHLSKNDDPERGFMTSLLRVLGLLFAVVVSANVARAQETGRSADEAAIRAIARHWEEAWQRFDASVLTNDYAADADFMDAFGNRHKGSEAIVNAMTRQLASPQVRQRQTTWKAAVVRFVRNDVAIVYQDYETVGQTTPTGEPVAKRDTRSVRMLTKDGGQWRIVTHYIMDPRESALR
jgi:uncharacterized protein (TIGR02246 family)